MVGKRRRRSWWLARLEERGNVEDREKEREMARKKKAPLRKRLAWRRRAVVTSAETKLGDTTRGRGTEGRAPRWEPCGETRCAVVK